MKKGKLFIIFGITTIIAIAASIVATYAAVTVGSSASGTFVLSDQKDLYLQYKTTSSSVTEIAQGLSFKITASNNAWKIGEAATIEQISLNARSDSGDFYLRLKVEFSINNQSSYSTTVPTGVTNNITFIAQGQGTNGWFKSGNYYYYCASGSSISTLKATHLTKFPTTSTNILNGNSLVLNSSLTAFPSNWTNNQLFVKITFEGISASASDANSIWGLALS